MGVGSVLNLKLVIDGSNKGAIAALSQLSAESQKTGGALSRLDLAAGNLDKTRGSVASLTNDIKGLQGSVLAFAGAAGLSLSVAGVVQLADAYSQMTGRLKLVTQYSGDYAEVQQLLVDSARSTRSDLVATFDLYGRMAPSLKGIGLSGKETVGVITTINQAIGLSGASAQAASAALMQLGQGFGAGALRGEELNSILEQTPAVAQAIADGLGVPIGELRKLGEEGKLTAEVVAGALQKMAPQLEADFAKMPKTVSQALTGLRNEFLLFVGATDSATGGSSALANVIEAVGNEFKEAGPVVTAFSTAIKTMANGLDGAYRLLKIMGLGLAGYAAAAKAALTGNFSEAKTILAAMGADVAAVLEKPLVTMPKIVDATVDSTKKRALLEAQLAAQVENLEKAKAYIAGTASDSIAAKDKANIDARIADQQRLVDAVRSAWQASLAEAEKAANSAQQRLQKATDFKQRGQDAAFDASTKGLSPEDQAVAQSNRLSDLQGQGNYESARARVAALEGDAKKFDATAAIAEKKLLAALALAEKVGDATAAEDIGNELAKLNEAGAKLDQKKSDDLKAQAEAQAATLNTLQAQLEKMKADARAIEVSVDVAKGETAVKGLQSQLAELKDKTVTVTVNTVNAGSAATPAAEEPTVTRAYGGPLPGHAPHDRADNVIYRGTPGEFLIQRPTVKQRGALAFLYDFNRRGMAALHDWQIPGHAFGGEIGGSLVNRLAVPGVASRQWSGANGLQPAILKMPDGSEFPMSAQPDVIGLFQTYISREARRKGGRK